MPEPLDTELDTRIRDLVTRAVADAPAPPQIDDLAVHRLARERRSPWPLVAAVGLSNLQYVDLNSPRNLFILGFAFFMGLSLPQYFATNPLRFEPQWAADLLNTLGSTGMAVGALISMVLDNVIPGSASERGHDAWHAAER